RNWYSGYDPALVSQMSVQGYYTGSIDRSLRIERQIIGALEPLMVGTDEYIPLRIETIDPVNRNYSTTINIGTLYYTPGEQIPLILTNEEDEFDKLDLGFSLSFSTGIVDTSLSGAGALIDLDVQDFEGFHVWRGLTPYPSDMQTIVEISKEDYFKVSDIDVSVEVPVKWLWLWEYFRDTNSGDAWPRFDDQGREYYEWVDQNAFAGFTYFYQVTTFDRGFFKNAFQHNKEDSWVCDEDLENPVDPENPVDCEDIANMIVMTVDAGGNTDDEMKYVYAVPNPYRTGTSAETSPAYHNFPDNSIKFFNVPAVCDIKIYTVSGDLVWEGSHANEGGDDGIISWNVMNKEGNEVSSGVYIYRIESETGGARYGKIVVIR
ncbi:MAG TPA: hypothetical protein VLA34_10420, partial [Candidatus Krumholzibacterium sp.]|nr:hypothetical protein [Candidatus Krumholzibacterium sp.]